MNDYQHEGCCVATPTLVYAWPASRTEFDKIAIPETVHAWKPCSTTTLVKNDGRQWERRVHSKTVNGPVMVVFQWFDERPMENQV